MQDAKKVALITGANKGIGFEVARQIAKAGWTVLAAARNAELGGQAAATLQAEGLDVRFIHLDLDAHETAAAAAETIREQFGKLDLLINNAAIAGTGDGPPSKVGLHEAKLYELAESIKHNGLIQPITVRPNNQGFEIVAGARRYRAAQLAELFSVPGGDSGSGTLPNARRKANQLCTPPRPYRVRHHPT
jgi:NAD(P)-dependent dehydrogenase (short-subunit alcohol dehydrogenase family)